MKISVFFRQLIRLFHEKNRETPLAKRSLEEVFSFTIGEPDDELIREAFRMLRERWNELEAKKMDRIDDYGEYET